MEDDQKYFYAKFKIDSDLEIVENLFISEDRATIEEWKGSRARKEDENISVIQKKPSQFAVVMTEFEESINTFKTTVPFIMGNLPIMRRLSDDHNIRQFVAKNGELIRSDEIGFELYRITIDHAAILSKKLERSSNISSGINKIPGLFLMGLISSYDQFLSQLIRCMFISNPEMLSSSERNISFKDLIEIGSVEAARERVIEKAIESIIRDNHSDHIEWLESTLNMPLRKDLKIWPEFIEICERRNLIAHTNGTISSQYITNCKKHGCNVDELIVGNVLEITSTYYERAVSVILEFGIKLTQVVWRKLKAGEIEEADQELNKITFRLITKRMYKEATILLRFGLFEMKKHGTELFRKMMVVNLANAEKLSGNKSEAEKILNDEDWSASTDTFVICVAAVRDDTQTVINLMKAVVDAGHLTVANFREWPVFENIRSDSHFVETFEREFGQRMVADLEASTASKTELEEPSEATSGMPGTNSIH
jgi:hypothetical protein